MFRIFFFCIDETVQAKGYLSGNFSTSRGPSNMVRAKSLTEAVFIKTNSCCSGLSVFEVFYLFFYSWAVVKQKTRV